MLETIIIACCGVAAGAVSSAGVFAVITSVRLVNRIATCTKSAGYIHWYENLIIIGITGANVISIYEPVIWANSWVVGIVGCCIGVYVGLFAVSLAETIKVMPIMAQRTNLKQGFGVIITCMAFSKLVGELIYFFGGK